MSALPNPKDRYTLDEYLDLEFTAETRYEYFDGEIVDMAGGTLKHSQIRGNVYYALQQKLRKTKCQALNSEMRVKVPRALPYRYPDASVVCGEPQIEKLGALELLLNPVLLVEVLSESTEK